MVLITLREVRQNQDRTKVHIPLYQIAGQWVWALISGSKYNLRKVQIKIMFTTQSLLDLRLL